MVVAHMLGTLLPPSSMKLGRLVLNAKRPHQDFIDPLNDRPAQAEYDKSHHENFTETRKFSRRSKLRLGLGDILSFSFEDTKTAVATLTAPNTTNYDLLNSEEWFQECCGEPETRRWLEKSIDKRRSVYLIVGFRTVLNAKLTSKITTGNKARTDSNLPIGAFESAPAPLNPIAKIEPNGNHAQVAKGDHELTFEAPGEQVFAVLYRKVKFNWLSSRTVHNMNLEQNNRWRSVWDWRGPNEEEDEDEDDILEANLTDMSDLDISDEEDTSLDDLISCGQDALDVVGTGEQNGASPEAPGVSGGKEQEPSAVCVETVDIVRKTTFGQGWGGLVTPVGLLVWGFMGAVLLLLLMWMGLFDIA